MNKPLSQMSREELWQLFPIQLTEHQVYWQDWYQIEKERLLPILPSTVKMHHIGSTAINGIWAKPIIDILVEATLRDHEAIKSLLLQNDYICMAQTGSCIDFNKGYTPDGFADKVFHLHLRKTGDNEELYFRDYMNEHPKIAKIYEKMKLSLWKQFEHNRDGYTESKTAFISEYTQKAIVEYGNIYG